MMTLSPRAWVV